MQEKRESDLERVKLDTSSSQEYKLNVIPDKTPKIRSIVIFMLGMALMEFAQKDLTGS